MPIAKSRGLVHHESQDRHHSAPQRTDMQGKGQMAARTGPTDQAHKPKEVYAPHFRSKELQPGVVIHHLGLTAPLDLIDLVLHI